MKDKTKRLCVVCGARVTNKNPKVRTCDAICTIAKDGKITRERAARILANCETYHIRET